MYSKKINELATNLNPQETDLIPIGDANTGQLKTTTYNAISGISGDGVISGGIVTWTGTGLNFNISACTYILNGIRYTSPASTKTLAAADPTNDRIDVFAVDVNSQVVVIQGTPATNPIEPEGDTATTLGLTNVTIAAGATTPSGVNRDLIYDENVESWTKSVSVGAGTTYNLADTAFAYTGSKSILATMGPGFIFFSFSKAVAMDISNYKSLSFAIRLNAAWTSNQILSVRFFNGSTFVTNNFQIGNNNNVGFNRNLAGQWQLITIPLNNTNLKFTNNAFTLIRIGTQNAACTYRLDTIQLNGGINNPIGGGTTPSNSFGFVNGSTGTAASTTATDTLSVVGTGLATTSASGKTLTIAVPTPIPSQTGNNGKYLTTDGSSVSWATVTSGNIYTQDGTLTANRTLTSGGFNLTFTGSNTASAAIARGILMNHTLTASANNDILVGLDINPTFTNGAFTGVKNYAIRYGSFNIDNGFNVNTTGSVLISGDFYGGAFRGNYIGNSSGTNYVRVFSNNGNVLLQNGGTFTDAGYRLDVNGTARVQGKLSVNTPTEASAVMEVTSITQGFLPPRMTTTQRNAIVTPATGLQIYNTTTNTNDFYNGTAWTTAGGSNIYNADGTLTANRTISSGGFNLTIAPPTMFSDRLIVKGNNQVGFTGAGLVFSYVSTGSGYGQIQAYDYTGATFKDISIGGGSKVFLGTPYTTSATYACNGLFEINIDGNPTIYGLNYKSVSSTGFFYNRFYTSTTERFLYGYNSSTGGFLIYNTQQTKESIFIFNTTNNISINSLTDAGYKLDVNGTTRLNGNTQTGLIGVNRAPASTVGVYIKGSGSTSSTYNLLGTDSAGNNLYTFLDDGTLLIKSVTKNGTSALQVNGANISILGNGNYYELNNSTGAGIKNNLGDFYIDAISSTASIFFRNGTSPTTKVSINSSGTLSVGTTSPNASAILQVDSTTKGFLPPRMTTTQKNAIATPAAGLIVYDTTTNKLCCYDGTAWNDLF